MNNQLKNINLIKVAGSLVAILAILNLIGSNLLATKGHEVESLTQQTKNLQKENTYLSNQISQKSSLSYIENQALAQGFEKISQPIALTASTPVAMLTR